MEVDGAVAHRFEGTISARAALVKSKNAATVRLGMATGIKEGAAFKSELRVAKAKSATPNTPEEWDKIGRAHV